MKNIKFASSEVIATKEVSAFLKNGRSLLKIVLETDYATARGLFADGISYAVSETVVDENGQETTAEYDKSEYCKVFEIADHCNGEITVTMGKKTATELLEEENAQLMFELLTGEEY